MNRKLLIVLLGVFTLATMNSCKEEDGGGKAVEITGGQQKQTVYADADKGSGGVTFKTAGAWTSTVTEGGGTRSEETDEATRAIALWISISPSSGSSAGSYTIDISLEDNYTGADRTATITISCGGESITIVVTQKGTTESGEQPVEEVAVTGVSLNKTSTALTVGDSETLTATVIPANATNQNVTWSSSDKTVATIDENGKINAVSPGTATVIVATADGGKTAICNVTVNAATVAVTGVSLNKASTTLTVGDKETLTATIIPANATNRNVTWVSSNPSVVGVENGEITAIAPGTASITVSTADGGKTAICSVTVNAATVAVTGVDLNKTNLSLVEGANETLIATVVPTGATNKNVTWKSSAVAIATVDANGKVTAVKAGTTTITVTTADGAKTAACTVTVTAKTVAVTGVGLNKSTLSLVEGASETLAATVAPANATNKSVSWTSNNTSIATVDASGRVTAVKAGTATITVTTADGAKTADCAVTVTAKTPDEVKVTRIDITPTGVVSVEAGKTTPLSATVSPTNATNKAVTWSSGNTSIATVNASSGVVTGVSAGTVTITATTNDGSGVKQTKDITVTPAVVPVAGVSLNKSTTALTVNDSETLAATVTPANATNKNVTWTSNDPSVATVDANGKVTAVKVGTTAVTVTTQDGGKTATCTVTVNAPINPVGPGGGADDWGNGGEIEL